MGWNSWNRFGPFVSERLVLETADALIESGMRYAGYRYVVIDDAWHQSVRDDAGDLAENRWAFPHGLRWLGDRIHERGLRFGLYTDAGRRSGRGGGRWSCPSPSGRATRRGSGPAPLDTCGARRRTSPTRGRASPR